MRKSTAIAGAASIVVAVVVLLAWYWTSPFFAVASLRDAALQGDTKELNARVDFARLREGIKTQFQASVINEMAENLRENPFSVIGVALAAKLADVMVDAMVTPAGIAALVESGKDRPSDGVSGLGLMLSSNFDVNREGLSSFDFYSTNEREKTPTLRFGRDGLNWRLISLQMPKEFLTAKMGNAGGGSRPTAPYVPKWEFRDHKDPIDDTVTLVLSRGADEEVSTRFSRVRPTLIFRCREKKLDAYINVNSSVDFDYQSYRTSVRLRFDENPAMRESWSVSDDREALFSPNATAFLNSLLKAAFLKFEWRQSGITPTVASFTRGDLEVHFAQFANRCGNPVLAQLPREPISYFVPILVLSSADKVQQMRKILTANGIKSYTEEIRTSKGSVTRVHSGPYSSREAAERAREQVRTMGLSPGHVQERYQGQ